MRILKLLPLVFSCVLPLPLFAAQATTAQQLRAQAETFLDRFAESQATQHRKVSYELGPVDSRLRLADCETPIQVSFLTDPQQSVRNTLQAQCKGQRPWRLFLNADVTIQAKAYVAKTPLARGSKIQAGSVELRSVTINQAHGGIFQDDRGLVGMEMRRSVAGGTLMTPGLLTAPEVVARGDRVVISAQVASIVVSSRGTALSDGRQGEQILVKNESSDRTVKAIVTGPGQVEVPM